MNNEEVRKVLLKQLEEVIGRQNKVLGNPAIEIYYTSDEEEPCTYECKKSCSAEQDTARAYSNVRKEVLNYNERMLEKYLTLRLQNIQFEINKLEAAERFLNREEVVALIMLKGRQREINSMLGKVKNQSIFDMIIKEEVENE